MTAPRRAITVQSDENDAGQGIQNRIRDAVPGQHLTSLDILARALDAVAAAHRSPLGGESLAAARASLAGLTPGDVKRVAVCLAVVGAHAIPQDGAKLARWLDRQRAELSWLEGRSEEGQQ